jgi:hypothetical protein
MNVIELLRSKMQHLTSTDPEYTLLENLIDEIRDMPPDGWAVLQPAKSAPHGFWFVGAYHDPGVYHKFLKREPDLQLRRIYFHDNATR